MNKLQALRYLEGRGLNVHTYEVVTRARDLMRKCVEYGSSSVRFDRHSGKLDLPFALMDAGTFDYPLAVETAHLAERLGCYLIVSNGRNYDVDMEFNICAIVQKDGSFECELSSLKIPLRKMYAHPLVLVQGNMLDPLNTWKTFNVIPKGTEREDRTIVDNTRVRQIMKELYGKGIFNKYIECTTYYVPVGKRNEYMVYWHIWE
jgi:hypothetical protein